MTSEEDKDYAIRMLDEHVKSRRLREMTQKTEESYKKKLKSWLQDNGEEDEKGNFWLAIPDERVVPALQNGKRVVRVKSEKRQPIVLDEEKARELLGEKKLLDQVIQVETVEVIDEDEILALNFSGDLTDAELSQIFKEGKPSFALKLENEDMEDE